MTGTGVLPGLLDFLHYWVPPTPDMVPMRIRLHPSQRGPVLTDPLLGPQAHTGHLLAMEITWDDRLPAGVWQVCALDGSLIRDSRSTNDPNEVTP